MKSLLDIQKNIRELENNVKEITESIRSISSDIEGLRNQTHDLDIDYTRVKLLAKQIPFGEHPLNRLNDERACRTYIEMLLNIVRLDNDEKTSLDRLVLIQWFLMKSNIEWSLEDLVKECYKIKADSFYELADFIPEQYRECFTVDALIIANLGGGNNREVYEYVADLIAILGVDKKKLKILSMVARATLCQSLGDMKLLNAMNINEKEEFLKYARIFNYYINNKVKVSIIESCRRIVVDLSESETVSNVWWLVKTGQKINVNDIIASYMKERREGTLYTYDNVKIKSPSSGTVFTFDYNGTYYAVLSDQEDDKDAIRTWLLASRRH